MNGAVNHGGENVSSLLAERRQGFLFGQTILLSLDIQVYLLYTGLDDDFKVVITTMQILEYIKIKVRLFGFQPQHDRVRTAESHMKLDNRRGSQKPKKINK